MKQLITLLVVISMVGTPLEGVAQWRERIRSSNPTFSEVQEAFYDFWRDKPVEGGGISNLNVGSGLCHLG